MRHYCYRIEASPVEWRIPADSREEADQILCGILQVQTLPRQVRFVGEKPCTCYHDDDSESGALRAAAQ